MIIILLFISWFCAENFNILALLKQVTNAFPVHQSVLQKQWNWTFSQTDHSAYQREVPTGNWEKNTKSGIIEFWIWWFGLGYLLFVNSVWSEIMYTMWISE